MSQEDATKKPSFIDWAADVFITEAAESGHTADLMKSLEKDTEEQWVRRITPVMERLQTTYVFKFGFLAVYEKRESMVDIFRKLKEKVGTTPQLTSSQDPASV